MIINKRLLPIKLHYFLFMGALGPILPQIQVIGKDLGISSSVMGTVTGILPFTFLLTKPLFGLLIDVYRQYRRAIFLLLIAVMTISFGLLYFVPNPSFVIYEVSDNHSSSCNNKSFWKSSYVSNHRRTFACPENSSSSDNVRFYKSLTFWSFITLMSIGTIGFNVINSISDAMCYDIVEKDGLYGRQRLWGSIGFGVTALISGYLVDFSSNQTPNYSFAYIVMAIFSVLDLLVCVKIEIPVIEAPSNILKDLKMLLTNAHVLIFVIFTILAGMLDGLIIYFLFWYLEDFALETKTSNVKLLEGLILAAETLGAEVLFFFISGKILQRLGHVHCFTMCFFNYSLRLVLIAFAPSPWWFLPIEFLMQGPTFALTYTAIVEYANELAPSGMTATMQGIATGMADGTGYALGSIAGGLFYQFLGGKNTFKIFGAVAAICGILHFIVHKTVLNDAASFRRRSYEIIC